MTSEHINPAGLARPSGFSHAVSVPAGRMVFLAGQIGVDRDSNLAEGGVVPQFEQALDNLLLVHGRIGTLDISALTAMIWGATLYLRGRPVLAGAVIGIGACAKEVAPYVLLVLVVLELFRWWPARTDAWRRIRRLVACGAAAAGAFLALLFVLGQIAAPYSPQTGKLVPNGPFGEVGHILSYASHQTSPHGPKGIASYPWAWLVDSKSITYLRINPAHPTPTLDRVEPAVHFLGLINPVILLLAIPGLLYAARGLLAGRGLLSSGRLRRLSRADAPQEMSVHPCVLRPRAATQ